MPTKRVLGTGMKSLSLRLDEMTWATLRKEAIDLRIDFHDYLRAALRLAPELGREKIRKAAKAAEVS